MFASGLAALMTFPLAFGATAAIFLLLDARARQVEPGSSAIGLYGRGLKLFGRLFGVYFMIGLALLAPAAPALVLWKLGLIAAAIPLGAIAVCFDIWLLTRWSVAAPVAVLEDSTFSVAFARSRDLVRGAWWKTFGVMVLIATVEAVVAGVIWVIAQGAVTLTDAEGPTVSAISSFTINVVTAPLEGAVFFALYAGLRDREISTAEINDD